MIFKTFENNDVDKWTAKIGLFGKSFNDVIDSINKRKLDIDNLMSSGLVSSYSDAKKQVGGLFSYLYPKKDIKSQLIDVDTMYPKIDTSNVDKIKTKIVKMSKSVSDGKKTWQELFDTLPVGEKHFAELGQQMEGQIITEEGLITANEKARASALAHNNALKQQTLGAKAASFALGALKNVLNVAVSYLVSWGISKLIQTITDHIHRADKAVKKMGEAIQKVNSVQKEYSSNAKSLSEIEDRFVELSKGVNSFSENMKLSENEYLKLSQEIADLAPDLVYGYDSQGNALLLIGDNAEQTREKLKELREEQEKQKNQTALDNADKIANGQACSNLSKYSKYGDVSVIEYGGSSLIVKWLAGFPTSGQASYNIGMCNGSGYYQRYKRGGEITENQNLDVIARSMGEDHIATIAYYNSYQTKMRYYSVQY